MFRPCIAVLCLVLTAPAAAQRTDTQIWTSESASAPIGGTAEVTLDSTQRFGDAADGLYEMTGGALIGVEVADGVQIAGGFQRQVAYSHGRATRSENRTREQVSLAIRPGLSARLRLEQRYRDAPGVGWRIRPRVSFSQPLGRGSPALLLWHESFFELNDTGWGQDAGWRRMRNFIGIDVPVTKRLRLQPGYLNQYDFTPGGGRDSMANVALVSAALRF